MRSSVTRYFPPCRLALTLLVGITVGAIPAAHAAVVSYTASLNGAVESPTNLSPGLGLAQVDVDAAAHTMHVHVDFNGLLGITTASHIHAATAVPGTGTAGVATTTPTFAGFPLNVSAGTYDITMDMTLATSYNPSFVTAHGGLAGAEAFLFQSIADGAAYLNIHTNQFPGGEIRGFLVAGTTPANRSTWGRIKSLYR